MGKQQLIAVTDFPILKLIVIICERTLNLYITDKSLCFLSLILMSIEFPIS